MCGSHTFHRAPHLRRRVCQRYYMSQERVQRARPHIRERDEVRNIRLKVMGE